MKAKFKPPISIVKWNTEFDISEKKNWESIFFNKIKDVKDTFLAEFNYKLLNNLLSNNLLISKWNTNTTNKCKSCISEIENAKHLIFECINVQNIWKVASRYLNFDILWKHKVGGFYLDKSETTKIYNSFISYIAYRIYKSKMYCRIEQIDETCTFIKDHVKKNIKSPCLVLSLLCKTKEKKLFETFISNL